MAIDAVMPSLPMLLASLALSPLAIDAVQPCKHAEQEEAYGQRPDINVDSRLRCISPGLPKGSHIVAPSICGWWQDGIASSNPQTEVEGKYAPTDDSEDRQSTRKGATSSQEADDEEAGNDENRGLLESHQGAPLTGPQVCGQESDLPFASKTP